MRALDQFKSGNFAAAVTSFQAFVRTYPRSPLAPSAIYWSGNAQYALKDFRGAITTQRQLLAAYPDSQKVPDAMLNIASCQVELGDAAGIAAHARGSGRQVSGLGSSREGPTTPRRPVSPCRRSFAARTDRLAASARPT